MQQPPVGATAPNGLQPIHAPQSSNAPQTVGVPPVVSTASGPGPVPQQQPMTQQQQQQQQLATKQNKVTPITKPAGVDPVVILQVTIKLILDVPDLINLLSFYRSGRTDWLPGLLIVSTN